MILECPRYSLGSQLVPTPLQKRSLKTSSLTKKYGGKKTSAIPHKIETNKNDER
jgi:hypothetical protein